MAVEIIPRKIVLKVGSAETILDDPNPGFSADQVRSFHQGKHPQLVNAAVEETTTPEGGILMTFKTYVGTKG